MPSAANRRPYSGPPLFSFGFRPFFLFAAAWPAASIPLWVLAWQGVEPFAGHLTRDWHAHEMLFGYLGGVVAGFLLTAVPNWTGRPPVTGAPLAGLSALWVAGRLAMIAGPADSPWTAVVECAFLIAFAAVIWREVLAGRNWRNLPVAALTTVLAAANVGVHLRPSLPDLAGGAERLALGAAALLIALIGGRVVPSFTRNWLARRGAARLPAPVTRFDTMCLGLTGLAGAAWVALPEHSLTGAALAAAGAANLARLARWRGQATLAEPLVWVLHAGYAWLGAGLLLLGLSILGPASVPRTAGIHALTVGAIGVMTLAMMTRATRGHTGRPLEAGRTTLFIYMAANTGALLRVAAPFAAAQQPLLLSLSSLAWSGAFAAFLLVYGPMLAGRRIDSPARAAPAAA